MQPLFRPVGISPYLVWALVWSFGFQLCLNSIAADKLPDKVASVEGMNEYVLDNGVKVLLFSDRSQPKITINSTVLVGSRDEGYQESGMSHLLERLLFKGTELYPRIQDALSDRGASFRGSTSFDRTSFIETLNATDENLEFAIQLEADRFVNGKLLSEDLQKEIAFVRSEMDKRDNSPVEALRDQMLSSCYRRHAYGRSLLGNKLDIERVSVESLRAFYRKHYRPDNVVLLIAGSFDEKKTIGLVRKYFGPIEKPAVPIAKQYASEPPQEGERTTVTRRVGNVQLAGCLYHIPSGADPEFASLELLAAILADEPRGRLHKSLVETKKANKAHCDTFRVHDPGVLGFFVQVPPEKPIEEAQLALLSVLENMEANPISAEEVDWAKQQLLNKNELSSSKMESLADDLGDWAAIGDWRLYFLHRDAIEKATAEQIQQVALKYLVRNNRTLGLFLRSTKTEKTEIARRPSVAAMVQEYTGREAISEGEPFNPTPKIIEDRLVRGELKTGIPYAFLQKKTRGHAVTLILNLRFGDEKSLAGKAAACQFLGQLMQRGTKSQSLQQLIDHKEKLKSVIEVNSKPQLLEITLETRRDKMQEAIELLQDILRNPALEENEFSLLKDQVLHQLESKKRDPEILVQRGVNRVLNPYKRGDIRYVSTVDEELEDYRNLKLSDVKDLHSRFLSGTEGELVAIGDFEPKEMEEKLSLVLANWKSKIAYQRIATAATTDVKIPVQIIEVPEKSNCSYLACQQYAIRDDHPKYAALLIGNTILGGSGGNSRLGNRVRNDEGLSQNISSSIFDSQIDECATLSIAATASAANRDKLVKAIDEEIRRLVKDGVSDKELKDNIQGFLQNRRLARSRDPDLARLLAKNLFAGRTMEYYEKMEVEVAGLSVEDVNEAIREYISPDRFIVATAGDFAKTGAPKQ